GIFASRPRPRLLRRMNPETARRDETPALPARIEGLAALATNIAWSWHRQARALFRRIDPVRWHGVTHNPIDLLRQVPQERLEALVRDADFLAHYDKVIEWFAIESTSSDGWFRQQYPDIAVDRPVAYFCAEFGLHNSVPIYSGGLGVLAGDHVKTASDLALPFVGVGLFYKKGYFDQHVRPDGWQEDGDDEIEPELTPLVLAPTDNGNQWHTAITTAGRTIYIRAWTMMVGRAPIYLLDTDLED